MRAVFFGTPEFALPSLNYLIKEHDVAAVVTQPDKPKGRGKHLSPPPVKEEALKHGIPVLQPVKMRGFYKELECFNADIFVVAAYGRILRESILKTPPKGCICVHASLLPNYRGAAPIQRAVINGEKTTGITIMQMDKGIDTGGIILQKAIEILACDTSGSMHDKLAVLGADALSEALILIERGEAEVTPQDDASSSYAEMIDKKEGCIDFNKSSKDIVNLIRGLNPWPCASVQCNDEMIKVFRAESFDCESDMCIGAVIGFNGGIEVKTNCGAVRLIEIQAQNGKRMSALDYLRGHKIEIGTVLK